MNRSDEIQKIIKHRYQYKKYNKKYKKSQNIYRLLFVSYVIHNYILFVLIKKKKKRIFVLYHTKKLLVSQKIQWTHYLNEIKSMGQRKKDPFIHDRIIFIWYTVVNMNVEKRIQRKNRKQILKKKKRTCVELALHR